MMSSFPWHHSIWETPSPHVAGLILYTTVSNSLLPASLTKHIFTRWFNDGYTFSLFTCYRRNWWMMCSKTWVYCDSWKISMQPKPTKSEKEPYLRCEYQTSLHALEERLKRQSCVRDPCLLWRPLSFIRSFPKLNRGLLQFDWENSWITLVDERIDTTNDVKDQATTVEPHHYGHQRAMKIWPY